MEMVLYDHFRPGIDKAAARQLHARAEERGQSPNSRSWHGGSPFRHSHLCRSLLMRASNSLRQTKAHTACESSEKHRESSQAAKTPASSHGNQRFSTPTPAADRPTPQWAIPHDSSQKKYRAKPLDHTEIMRLLARVIRFMPSSAIPSARYWHWILGNRGESLH